jgi:hypothetical protein
VVPQEAIIGIAVVASAAAIRWQTALSWRRGDWDILVGSPLWVDWPTMPGWQIWRDRALHGYSRRFPTIRLIRSRFIVGGDGAFAGGLHRRSNRTFGPIAGVLLCLFLVVPAKCSSSPAAGVLAVISWVAGTLASAADYGSRSTTCPPGR